MLSIYLTDNDKEQLKEVRLTMSLGWARAYTKGIKNDEVINFNGIEMTFEEYTALYNLISDITK